MTKETRQQTQEPTELSGNLERAQPRSGVGARPHLLCCDVHLSTAQILTDGEFRGLKSALGTQTSIVLGTVTFRPNGSSSATACLWEIQVFSQALA